MCEPAAEALLGSVPLFWYLMFFSSHPCAAFELHAHHNVVEPRALPPSSLLTKGHFISSLDNHILSVFTFLITLLECL